ncbi:hypothetical protein ACW6QP_09600 [Salegentibacter sp. HM20]
MYKKTLVIIFYFILNQGYAQLLYSEVANQKGKSEQNLMVEMVDSIGYKFYGLTNSIMDENLKNHFHSSKLKLLLIEMLNISENLIQSSTQNTTPTNLNTENTTFHEIRTSTLLNLQEASSNLVKNKEVLLFLDFNTFIESINSAHSYCDEIIYYRRNLGNPYTPRNQFVKKAGKISETFDRSRGADGLTSEQWVNIMRAEGGSNAPDLIRITNRENQNRYIKLKKRERAIVKVGEIQKIEKFSNAVDGEIYISPDFPPEQISFLYTPDDKLVKGLVEWLIFINSGNSTKLSEMFRVGINEDSSNDKSQLSRQFKRDIKDNNQNQIRVEFLKKDFSNIIINLVKIKNKQIMFLGYPGNRSTSKNEMEQIFIIKNVNGDLLERIKFNVNQMKKGLNDYDDSIMNLSKN